jgi:RNA polymerase-binding transcription factor
MNDTELEQIRQQLIRRACELRELEATSKASSRPVTLDQASVGRLSRMDAMQAQQMALETSRRRREELAGVEGALRRMEAGEYGNCFICGEEINLRRLAIAPTSTRCVNCADA